MVRYMALLSSSLAVSRLAGFSARARAYVRANDAYRLQTMMHCISKFLRIIDEFGEMGASGDFERRSDPQTPILPLKSVHRASSLGRYARSCAGTTARGSPLLEYCRGGTYHLLGPSVRTRANNLSSLTRCCNGSAYRLWLCVRW